VQSQNDARLRNHRFHRVVVVQPQHRHHMKKVVIYHPARHGRHEVNRTVVVHHDL
jgi:hypothetical protein